MIGSLRIAEIEVYGFRGFVEPVKLDLDADAVIVTGSNGQGKTSFFDAILWALTGTIPRLGDASGLVSKFSPSGEARVSLKLTHNNGEVRKIIRSLNRESGASKVVVHDGKKEISGPVASAELLELIWAPSRHAQDSAAAAAKGLARSVYLQQDLVRDYLEADSDDERFSVLSELVGVGRVTELQQELANAKKAWTRSLNASASDIAGLESTRAGLEEQLGSLSGGTLDLPDDKDWKRWWSTAATFVPAVEPVKIDASDAAPALENGLRLLDEERRALRSQANSLREIHSRLTQIDPEKFKDADQLRTSVSGAEESVSERREALRVAEEEASMRRKKLRERKQIREELSALAEIALRHIEGDCPVCRQTHDARETRRHLESLLVVEDLFSGVGADLVNEASAALALAEQNLAVVRARAGEAEAERRHFEMTLEEAGKLLGTDVEDGDLREILDTLEGRLTSISNRSNRIAELSVAGEALTLALARVDEGRRARLIETEIRQLKDRIANQREDHTLREKAAKIAGDMVDQLRSAEIDLVQGQLKKIQPLLSTIYAKVDPHPVFRNIQLISSQYYGKGRLRAEVFDRTSQTVAEQPQFTLSSSQLNALAVCLFLSLNLGAGRSALGTVLLDDPLQSLDDVNLLGTVDLLRRVRAHRQLIISTHDERFARLLERKLRPLGDQHRTVVVHFVGWSRSGPEIVAREVENREPNLRVVA